MTNHQVSPLSAGTIARSLFRHTKKMLAVFLLVMVATVCWIVFVPGEYESVAKVYVRLGRENSTLDPSATTGQVVNIEQSLESEINSMLQILNSQETAQRVVDEIGVDPILENDIVEQGAVEKKSSSENSFIDWLKDLKDKILPKRFSESREELAVHQVLKRSSVWAPKKSNVIEISYKAGHPKLAQSVTHALASAFVEEHLRITKTEGSLIFFVHQTERLKEQLETVEEDLKELKSSCNLVSIDGQRSILEEQEKSIRSRALANRSLLESSQAKVKELKTILAEIPARVEADAKTADNTQGWYTLRQRLFDLQIREQELKSRYSAANAEVIAVVQQRQAVEEILSRQATDSLESVTSTNPTYQMFQQSLLNEQAQIVSLVVEKETLETQMRENLAEFAKLNENALQIGEMERQRAILETSYLASAARMEQSKILQGLENAKISSIGKLQSASFSARPVGMGRFKILLFGTVLGLILGVGIAFLAEYFNRTFVTAAQVENVLDVPVLISIPQGRRQLMEVV